MNDGAKIMESGAKSAFAADARASGIPYKAIADRLAIPVSRLYAWLNDQQKDEMPTRYLPGFLAVCAPALATMQCFAAHAQCVVYPLPSAHADKAGAKAVKEFADVLNAHADGMDADGWTVQDIARFEQEAREAMASIAAWVECVKAQAPREDDLRSVVALRRGTR